MTKQGCYRVTIGGRARKAVEQLPKKLLFKVLAAMRLLVIDPRPKDCKKLSGKGSTYRLRVAKYRIVYVIQDDELLVLVVRVAHRRDAYKNL